MEQKQTQNGFKDEPCGKLVPDDFAGLCEYVAAITTTTTAISATTTTTTTTTNACYCC